LQRRPSRTSWKHGCFLATRLAFSVKLCYCQSVERACSLAAWHFLFFSHIVRNIMALAAAIIATPTSMPRIKINTACCEYVTVPKLRIFVDVDVLCPPCLFVGKSNLDECGLDIKRCIEEKSKRLDALFLGSHASLLVMRRCWSRACFHCLDLPLAV